MSNVPVKCWVMTKPPDNEHFGPDLIVGPAKPNPQLDLLRPLFSLVTLLTLYKQLFRWVPLWCKGQTPCAIHHYLLLSAWCSIVFAFSKISHDATACMHVCLWFAEGPCSLYVSEELRQGHREDWMELVELSTRARHRDWDIPESGCRKKWLKFQHS